MSSHAELRREAFRTLRSARVSVLAFAALSLLVSAAMDLLDTLCSGTTYEELAAAGPLGTFVYILTLLIALLLEAGRAEYCAAAVQGRRAEYSDLFCGFSYVFRFLSVMALQYLLVALGFTIFLVPGFLLLYRYRFVLYILCEDPSQRTVDILRRSGEELRGFKWRLFRLDLSFLPHVLVAILPLIWWQTVPAEALAGLPVPVLSLIGAAVTFPYLLLSYWRAAADLLFRERLLAEKYPEPPAQ